MRKYFYEVVHAKSRQTGKPLTRIYLQAFPRFSHREMFSKQEQLLDRLTDPYCHLDHAFQIAVTSDLSISSLCIAKIDHLDKIEKTINFSFSHTLEIVTFYQLDVPKFIEWLSSFWKGEYTNLTEVIKTDV